MAAKKRSRTTPDGASDSKAVRVSIKSTVFEAESVRDGAENGLKARSAPQNAGVIGAVNKAAVIVSRLTEPSEAAGTPEASEADGTSDSRECIEYVTDGVLRRKGSKIEVSYEESELMGLGGCTTTLHTDTAEPGLITLTRSGAVSACLTFNAEKRRQLCTYNTEYMPIQFIVHTRQVTNTIGGDGGTLSLDYDIELNGVRTERNLISLDVVPKRSQPGGVNV